MKITLRAARINNEFTIKQVANRIGVSEEILRNFERERTVIPENKLDALLELYGINKEELKGAKGK